LALLKWAPLKQAKTFVMVVPQQGELQFLLLNKGLTKMQQVGGMAKAKMMAGWR
jgi:hypothetical protein